MSCRYMAQVRLKQKGQVLDVEMPSQAADCARVAGQAANQNAQALLQDLESRRDREQQGSYWIRGRPAAG
jgi:hypothetical protein